MCKYIDMPLQHISNLTLLSMQRPPRQHTEALLLKLRERIPGLALRTTFISGALFVSVGMRLGARERRGGRASGELPPPPPARSPTIPTKKHPQQNKNKGFPGETPEQHRELVDFCSDFKFERMGCFVYSEEDGTPAAGFPEQLAPKMRCVGSRRGLT